MIKKKLTFLIGNLIYLRPLIESDIEGNYIKWLNDQEVLKFNSHGRFPMTYYKLLEYVKSSTQSNQILVFAIIDIRTESHIGNISLQSINWVDRNAEIAFLLGEKEFWSQGIMYDAGKLLINHAFNSLNLYRIYCGTSSNNFGMQRLALKLGMNKEGERKGAIYNNGNYYSIFEYGILKNNKDEDNNL